MAEQIISVESVHPGAYLQCTSWLIHGPQGCVLVDPGSRVGRGRIIDCLHRQNILPSKVAGVLLTHCHCDHALDAGFWQDELGIPVHASPFTADKLASANPIIWQEHPELLVPTEVDVRIEAGSILRLAGMEICCLATPGHTPGCMTFLVPSDQGGFHAFTGDLLMADSRPGWAGDGQYDPQALQSSLERLLAMDLYRAYTGHGEPIDEVQYWLRRGLDLKLAEQWHPTTAFQAMKVPVEFIQCVPS